MVISEDELTVPLIGGPFDGTTITGRGLPPVLVIGTLSAARILDYPTDAPDGVLCRYVARFDWEPAFRARYEFATENTLTWDGDAAP